MSDVLRIDGRALEVARTLTADVSPRETDDHRPPPTDALLHQAFGLMESWIASLDPRALESPELLIYGAHGDGFTVGSPRIEGPEVWQASELHWQAEAVALLIAAYTATACAAAVRLHAPTSEVTE